MNLPRLWLITDRRRSARPILDAVGTALSGFAHGTAGVILREKDLPARELAELSRRLRALTSAHHAPLVVNGRFDVALATDADGVHLGEDAPPFNEVRRVLPRDRLVGVSLHAGQSPPADASYALLSPVFPTRSKPGAAPLGLDGLTRGIDAARGLPIFALGGVDASNAAACREAGAFGVAVIGALIGADDPAGAATRFARALGI